MIRPTAASSIRAALLVGLVAVFGLWLLSGVELLRSVRDLESRIARVHNSFMHGEQTLSTVRTNVLLGSIYLRDGLVDTGTVTRQFYRDELHQIRAETEETLPGYLPEVELPIERREWTALQRALDDYWDTVDLLFGPDAPKTFVEGSGVLRHHVVPARENVLQIVDRIAALQRLSRRRQQSETSLLDVEVRWRFLAVSGVTFLAAVFVAGFAVIRVGRIEQELHQHRLSEAEARRDLERLSTRLVNAQEDERRHLARELHDEVGQALTAIKMEIGIAGRSLQADPRARASLDEARAIAERTLQGVRDLSQFLHPSMLDDFGLPETLSAYVRSFAKRSGIRAEFSQSGLDQRLPGDVEVCVYRIIQEALTNVTRHSGAEHCSVSIVWRDDLLRLTIADDGRGIDAANATDVQQRGLGLIGMRERAQSLGGRFIIDDRPGGGTRVIVILPVSMEHNATGQQLLAG